MEDIQKFSSYIDHKPNSIKLSYYAFDWDDNILHMPTVIHMDKKEGNEWIPIDLSTSDFAIYRNDPGYRIRNGNPNEAFCEFRDFGPRGPKAFLMDCQESLSNGNFAPSWNAFLKCLSRGSIFSIITARGHEPESIREAIEYIIDTIMTKMPGKNPGRTLVDEMYQNIGKYMYYFREMNGPIGDIKLRGQPSKDKVIKKYLDLCDFYGVTSNFFAKEFGEGSTSNPEKAKEMAIRAFVDRCNGFGRRLSDYSKKSGSPITVKSVSIGFSDDDPRNVDHVKKFFHEAPVLDDIDHQLSLNVFDTSKRDIKGGIRTKHLKTNEVNANQSTGDDQTPGSILSNMRMPAGLSYNDPVKFSEFQKGLAAKVVKPTLDILRKRKKKKILESKKHPGFKKVSSKIANQQKLSIKKASAILAAATRKSSKKAKKKNPKLKKVK